MLVWPLLHNNNNNIQMLTSSTKMFHPCLPLSSLVTFLTPVPTPIRYNNPHPHPLFNFYFLPFYNPTSYIKQNGGNKQ